MNDMELKASAQKNRLLALFLPVSLGFSARIGFTLVSGNRALEKL